MTGTESHSIIFSDPSTNYHSGELGLPTDDNSLWNSNKVIREEPWAVPLLACATGNVVAFFTFEVFLIVRACSGTPSRRHLFLGQCLLTGLVLMSLSGLTFALQPAYLSCAASRVLLGVAPSIVFGTLLVKCVFLISLHSGVYLPSYYQGLLLFFIVLVQGAIAIQWISTQPVKVRLAENHSQNGLYLSCESTYKTYIISLLYVMVLILMVAIFSIKCRRVRANYRESSYIGFSLCVIVPMWLVWTLTGFVLPERVQPACLGFSSVATATIVFLIMFIPKARQMAASGKDGFFKEDRDSSLSSDSDEKFSPSFFMFQPIKSSKQNGLTLKKDDYSIFKTNCSGSSLVTGADEGIYATISSKNDLGISSNPNFYLFRSHANIEMMY